MAVTLKQARWYGAQVVRGIGLPGWVALALGLACALGWATVIEPMRAEARQLDADSDLLRQRAATPSRPVDPGDATPQQQLVAFERRFSDERAIAPSLARLQAAARRQGVSLDQAEFKFTNDPTEPLARYAITLPVQADYRALRRFTRDALRELPGLALDEVQLRRSDPKSPRIEAQLRFVLFVTKSPAVSTPSAVVAATAASAPAAN